MLIVKKLADNLEKPEYLTLWSNHPWPTTIEPRDLLTTRYQNLDPFPQQTMMGSIVGHIW